MPQIVSDPADVTSAWLTEVLEHGGVHATIADFKATNVGTGQVGQNVRFELDYQAGIGPASIVGKFASADPTSRSTGIAQNNYLKEVRFYQELKPSLDIQTPDVLFTAIDPASHDFCLMMEDLAPAEQGDQIAGCNAAQANLAITQAVRLHAPRWGDAALREFDWLGQQTAESADMGQQMYQHLFPGFVERYQSRLTQAHLNIAERLGASFAHWSNGYEGPLTVIHGDFRLDNMLFGGPYPLTVVDWQTPGHGAAMSDVAYFLGAGLTPKYRQRHEHDLVRSYHAQLRASGVDDYPFEDCWNHYRRFSFSGLLMAVIASMIVCQTDRGDDMFMAMASRHAQQAIDLQAGDFLRS
ncbi:MAG: aminoglycoside phosphotransferase family protein [Gammaproteobacteria bacterium]|nr:aminoglycoside phosphotransferase family protein [Gammaproteobacteria bacterium]